MSDIGITTTVPSEVLLAAGYRPIDLNNVFIGDPQPDRLVNLAERAGFPINCCTWIKGIYGVAMERGLDTVLCVTTGDCSNTLMLAEVFRLRGLKVMPFAYPERPDAAAMQASLQKLASTLGTTLERAEAVRRELAPARALAYRLDELTWKQGRVSGWENHLWLVSTSDFNGDHKVYADQVKALLAEAQSRQPYPDNMLRLAYIGVPPVYASDLYGYLERHGARVVFNEVQRQFSMPSQSGSLPPAPNGGLADQYTSYTYPYSVFDRLADIKAELARRRVDGVIHYVQAFCHRGIADIIMRYGIQQPVLTLEGNTDYTLTQHLRTRIEAFLDMLARNSRTRLKSEILNSKS